ncbi:Phage antitermination protein Q [Moraxella caviae]|uniref:Phage antitermination protein Q n=1 Tax=Moraxella caviae TaxID=34060 RepID=A0A378R917_9GAMM|nr:antiterminator Q family protein [Moraxella caviae]STZ14505.1 Phage antitermination protein Q [Moraxella caviae]VEW11315.1 Phage antitermination protein Q [Moraxella caviae]
MHEELIEWGKWARNNPDKLSYKSQWYEMIMRGNVPSKGGSYQITDEHALRIDCAVARLVRYSALLGRVFCLRYLLRLSERDIARDDFVSGAFNKHRRANRADVREALHKAEGFIASCLTQSA